MNAYKNAPIIDGPSSLCVGKQRYLMNMGKRAVVPSGKNHYLLPNKYCLKMHSSCPNIIKDFFDLFLLTLRSPTNSGWC